jgi:hypothetical protein
MSAVRELYRSIVHRITAGMTGFPPPVKILSFPPNEFPSRNFPALPDSHQLPELQGFQNPAGLLHGGIWPAFILCEKGIEGISPGFQHQAITGITVA